MIVNLSLDTPAVLLDLDNFRAFKARASCGQEGLPGLVTRHAAVLAQLDETHAWIRIVWLRSQSSDVDWLASLERMLDAARPHGWVSDDDTVVRAHVEWAVS